MPHSPSARRIRFVVENTRGQEEEEEEEEHVSGIYGSYHRSPTPIDVAAMRLGGRKNEGKKAVKQENIHAVKPNSANTTITNLERGWLG